MKKLLLTLIMLPLLNGCILLDLAKLPAFSNPTGAVVKAELMEASNLINLAAYMFYFSNQPGSNAADSFAEASITDNFLIFSMNLNSDAFYDRESVDKCKDSMSMSSALLPDLLNRYTLQQVNGSVDDNFAAAFLLGSLCDIQKGKMIVQNGDNGI